MQALASNSSGHTGSGGSMHANTIILVMLSRVFLAGLAPAVLLHDAHAANAGKESCTGIVEDGERLKCYDTRSVPPGGATVAETRSYLTRSWDLDNRDDDLLGDAQSPLRPYRGTYLIARKSSSPNSNPNSPSHPAATSAMDIDPTELKFQISQKAKVLNAIRAQFLGFTSVRLWGAYTQQSNWQAFNSGNSSPFRETNYEPELMLTFSTGTPAGLKLVNIGMAHQSNGRDLSGSRSWNKAYLQGGWESETVSVLVRGWRRIPESWDQDDNSDIAEYIGRGEIVLRWEPMDRSQVIDLILRNNLSAGTNRGFVQLDWATSFTVSKSAKLYVQFTSGYGESLIDYNYFQNTLGLGFSFRDW